MSYTARLENWKVIKDKKEFVLIGNVYDDRKNRFTDGDMIRTSLIEEDCENRNTDFDEGEKVKTKNSTYLLCRHY